MTRRDIYLLVAGAAIGWYIALLVVVLVLGGDEFNSQFSNPWRLFVALPSLVFLVNHFYNIWKYDS